MSYTPLKSINTFGATAVTTRVEAQTVKFTSFLIAAANPNRKQLIVLTHGSGNLHLSYFSPATYVTPVELFMHDTYIEDRYTGAVYGMFHSAPYGTATAVTFHDANDMVMMTSHGRNNNEIVEFDTITTTTGISINTPYYVVNEMENSFQLSLTLGGAVIALTNDGTGALDPLTGFVIITEISI